MPWSESSKQPPNEDMQDVYAGPEDFMEAGARGFLVTCVPDKEELALDQAMKMLRKACVKLYGGIKPIKSSTALFSSGYIAVDFMDVDEVTVLPNPYAQTEGAESQQEKENEEAKPMEEGDTGKEVDTADKTGKDEENTETAKKEETENKEDVTTDDTQKEMEDTEKETKMETQEGTAQEQDDGKTDDKDTAAAKEEESSETAVKSKSEAGDEGNKGKEVKTKEGEKPKTGSQKSKKENRKSREQKRKRKHEDATPKWPLMRPLHKFKAFRTELRNILFIKSDVPDPLLLVREVNELIIKRKPLKGYAIYQFLPIQGICSYSYWEVEVMCKRILAPFLPEDLEKPPSFGILMFDKLIDPGAEILSEIVRSAAWSLNPAAWQNHPICEPDVTIHLELIGSKIILSVMPDFMKYRQYSPFCLTELGEGKPDIRENQDDYEGSSPPSKEKSDSGKGESRGRSKNQSGKSRKREESSGKGKDEGSHDKAGDEEKDSKKIEKEEESTEEVEKQDVKEDEGETAKDDTEESPKKEEKKTPQKRGGRRAASQKKKN